MSSATPVPSAVRDESDSTDLKPVAADRRLRIAGLILVLAVAFLPAIVSSMYRVSGIRFNLPDNLVAYRYLDGILTQLTSLALLAYVIRQNGQTFSGLGVTIRGMDLVHGALLWGVTTWSYRFVYPGVLNVCELLGWHRTPPYLPASKLGFGIIGLCFVLVNPVFEEMIVRAFFMSETLALGGSAALAIVLSTLLQTSYHLYQGVPYALSISVVFLIFSIYYSKTRRIVPVILAHLVADFYAHLYWAMHQGRVLHS